MRVLIADDQKDVGRALADMVRGCNHQIVGVVGSGLEAINAYSSLHPDLILMDYRMPKLNGGTACRHIIARDPAARIVLVSAWSPLDGADKSGAISFLPKPVDFERLNATLQSIAETLPLPWPAEMPIPDLYYQPDTFQAFTFTPTPSSDLPAPNFEPVAEPSPVAPPFSETSVPADALQNFPEPTAEPCALKQKKSKTQRSTPNRRHVR